MTHTKKDSNVSSAAYDAMKGCLSARDCCLLCFGGVVSAWLAHVSHWGDLPMYLLGAGAVFFMLLHAFPYIKNCRQRTRKQLEESNKAQERGTAIKDRLDPSDKIKKMLDVPGDMLVVGGFAEYFPHFGLNREQRLSETGWEPGDVKIVLEDVPPSIRWPNIPACFDDFFTVMSKVESTEIAIPPKSMENNSKYFWIGNAAPIFDESPMLKLRVGETTFEACTKAFDLIATHPEEAQPFLRALPEQPRVPSILCLHFTLLDCAGNILCMKRGPDLKFHPNKFSITGEEQLKKADLSNSDTAMKMWFTRALAEEVFHYNAQLASSYEVSEHIASMLSHMRIFSSGMESEPYGLCLIGHARLIGSFDALKEKIEARAANPDHYYGHDREGTFFVMTPEQGIRLFCEGKSTITGFFTNDLKVEISSDMLHPTSLYRLYRVLRYSHYQELQSQSLL